MARKVSEGVGKKIVEALKKQSEIEINPISVDEQEDNYAILDEFTQESEILESEESEVFDSELDAEPQSDVDFEELSESIPDFNSEIPSASPSLGQSFPSYQQPAVDSFINELDSFEIPSNIAVLKKLIGQLPTGVSRHTGAQIIKQTMEALGISMKSVLQEAQQVQDGLNNSAKECYSTIQEYKKQIGMLEKQAQNYQRQYTALNELISLFIQTGV